MNPVFRLASRLVGNRFCQRALGRLSLVLDYLMGVGTGAGAASSGELVALDRMVQLSRSTYTIFDVGANKGQYLQLVAARLKDVDLEVHCFEPGRAAFQSLEECAAAIPVARMNRIALGREEGRARLYYDRPGSTLSSLSRRQVPGAEWAADHSEEVAVSTVDLYCSTHGIMRIDLLKLDVEGHELDVLEGASRMLSEGRVALIAFEFGGTHIDSRVFFRDIYNRLREADMSVGRITPSGYVFPLNSYRETYERFLATNFVAHWSRPGSD